MVCLLVCAVCVGGIQSDLPSLETIAKERGRFGFFSLGGKSWEDQVWNDPYFFYDSTMESDCMLFPAGQWNRRYLLKAGSISLTEKRNGRLIKVWWAPLCGEGDQALRGTGTLDAYFRRRGMAIKRNRFSKEVLKTLNATTPFAIYSHTMMTPELEGNFIRLNGTRSDEWTSITDYKGIGDPPGHGDPYPIADEEREWLASHPGVK